MRIVRQAWRYALPLLLIGLIAFPISAIAAVCFVFAGVGVLLFFRDPPRHSPPTGIVAPADGKISVIREEGDRLRVGIYMNLLNVHVNRSPVTGTVTTLEHIAGAHRPAFAKDSARNERVRLQIEGTAAFEVTLIAGAFARRITPYVMEGEHVDRGDRIGHIAFGSRADVLLPPEYERSNLRVKPGQRVHAGETVIGRHLDRTDGDDATS